MIPLGRFGDPTTATPRGAAGFSLVEVLVALTVSVLLLIGILNLFEANTRITRVQVDVSEMQQAQRVTHHELSRMVRMAGRGGLRGGALPAALAMQVRNDAGAADYISPGDDSTPEVLDGTDVLTVRGVFVSPIYEVPYNRDEGNGLSLVFETGEPTTSTWAQVTLTDSTNTGIPQSLAPLIESVQQGRPEPVIVVSPLSDQRYALVQLDTDNSNVDDPAQIVLRLLLRDGELSANYHTLSAGGAYPNDLASVVYLGVVEEYRFYIREMRIGDELVPTLAQARVYPGTERPYADSPANWAIDLADNVFDLQLALGADAGVDGVAGTAGDGIVVDGDLDDDVNASADEWLYNDAADNDALAKWGTAPFYYLRLTTLVRSARRDRGYVAPLLGVVEDHDYAGSPLDPASEDDPERWFRRRSLQTLLDVRNL